MTQPLPAHTGEKADDLWGGAPFAEYAHHRCCGCRHNNNSGSHGCPPWGICSLEQLLQVKTDGGLTCNRYAALPWVVDRSAILAATGDQS